MQAVSHSQHGASMSTTSSSKASLRSRIAHWWRDVVADSGPFLSPIDAGEKLKTARQARSISSVTTFSESCVRLIESGDWTKIIGGTVIARRVAFDLADDYGLKRNELLDKSKVKTFHLRAFLCIFSLCAAGVMFAAAVVAGVVMLVGLLLSPPSEAPPAPSPKQPALVEQPTIAPSLTSTSDTVISPTVMPTKILTAVTDTPQPPPEVTVVPLPTPTIAVTQPPVISATTTPLPVTPVQEAFTATSNSPATLYSQLPKTITETGDLVLPSGSRFKINDCGVGVGRNDKAGKRIDHRTNGFYYRVILINDACSRDANRNCTGWVTALSFNEDLWEHFPVCKEQIRP